MDTLLLYLSFFQSCPSLIPGRLLIWKTGLFKDFEFGEKKYESGHNNTLKQ